MRRLKRARQREAMRQAKRRKKFRGYAVTAGTAAAITFGTAVGVNKALADEHQLPVSKDADADLLANREEFSIGYRIFRPDQNRNQVPDGVELAKRCAAVINALPLEAEADPNETYKEFYQTRGTERCDMCGEYIHMGGSAIINPKLNLRYPDPEDPLDPLFLPDLAVHYMEHGSFDCYGNVLGSPLHAGRVDLQRLTRVLEVRFPYEPNDHQLPLDYVVEGVGQLAPDANDLDGDLLADTEELGAHTNLYDADQDKNLVPDGVEAAQLCGEITSELTFGPDPEDPNRPYINHAPQFGLETCDICGATVNMGPAEVVNPRLGLSVDCPLIGMHYMTHGSFSYAGDVHAGRIDVPLLLKVLEIPGECGHFGTMYLPGDLNQDCEVNLADIAEVAEEWLKSTDPNDGTGIEY